MDRCYPRPVHFFKKQKTIAMWRGTFTLWFSDAFSVQPLSSSSRGRRKFHHFRTNHCDPGEERKWRSAYVTSVGVSTKSLKKRLWFGGSVGGFFDGWIFLKKISWSMDFYHDSPQGSALLPILVCVFFFWEMNWISLKNNSFYNRDLNIK